MTIVVPNVGEVVNLDDYLKGEDLTLKLYANNITPAEGNTAATFTEVTGGGYAAKTLTAANWTITPGDPTTGLYAQQIFSFTGPTGGAGIIYGYYVVDALNVLRWAERFPEANVPLTPVSGSSIRITPRFQAS